MLKERIRVGILMGGKSGERNVSLASGCHVTSVLDPTRYEVFPIEIGMDGKWYLHHMDSPLFDEHKRIGLEIPEEMDYFPPSTEFSELVTGKVMAGRVDVMLLALHGPSGEDGTIQGFLETLGIPYTGSGVLASALTSDKGRCKVFLRAMNLPTPDWEFFNKWEWEKASKDLMERMSERFPEGCVVKPNNQGSSIGVTLVENPGDLLPAIELAFQYGHEVLVEKRICGREFTCGVYGKETVEALPVTEIIASSGFFDYESKYQPGGAEEVTPAQISEELSQKIRMIARQAHLALGCAGVTRTDFMLDGDNPLILEINTIPGMTQMSLIPRACQALGFEFESLLDRMIGEAMFKEDLITVSS